MGRVRDVVALLAAIALTACHRPTDYSVGVSGFTPERSEVIFDAADKWQKAVGNRVTVYYGCNRLADNDVCVMPGILPPGKMGQTLTYPSVSGLLPPPTVWISNELTQRPGLLSHVAQHELGHAFGLVHTSPGTVMYAASKDIDVQDVAAQDVTESDVWQFWSLR